MEIFGRSLPRPSRARSRKTACEPDPLMLKHWSARTHKSSRQEQSKSHHRVVDPDPSSDHNRDMGFTNYPYGLRSANGNGHLPERYAQLMSTEFSDATSSDWSLFTSSDEASFTTESTRDSFSTVDYADASNADPISSIFGNMYPSGYTPRKTLACNMFSTSRLETRFFPEQKGSVTEYFMPPHQPPPPRVLRGKNSKRVSLLSEASQTHGNTSYSIWE